MNDGVVRLNGVEVGTLHAFTPALPDIGSALVFPGENLPGVTFDDRPVETFMPGGPTGIYLPDRGPIAYTFPVAWANRPGIIRDVSVIYSGQPLIVDSRVEQTFDASLSHVEFITTLRTRGTLAANAKAIVAIAVENDVKGQCEATVVEPGVLQCTMQIAAPRLWSPANPIL